MEMIKAALHPTGGLSYHYMALKYKNHLWRRFQEKLNWLLCDWKHYCEELVLIGPSGGYSLSSDFLQPFKNIYIYDPDPLAKRLFQWRFPDIKIHWNFESPFFHPDKNSEQGLWKLKSDHPRAAILFCNVIGQWPLLEDIGGEKIEGFSVALNQVYNRSDWGSFHDVFSGPTHWKKWPHALQRQPVRFSNFDDVEKFWQKVQGGDLTDHLTFEKFQSVKNRQHLIWPLTPKQVHIIEWVHG